MAAQTHEFKAEVAALLNLVTNSLYTNKEIFLRELISNASDALDKARFAALVEEDLRDKDAAAQIRIVADKKGKTLTIEDTGIGMTADEAAKNLGTIAHSGTLEFLKAAKKDNAGNLDLIGQFGVGFYSAFMVADEVVVESLSAHAGSEAIRWRLKGDGTFSLEPGDRATRGTAITLQLKDDADEFLERFRIEGIVKRYSNYVTHPIALRAIAEDGEETTTDQVNAASPIWQRSPKDISDEEYGEFYKHVMGGWVMPGDEPSARLHLSMDAPIQFSAVLYVPGRAPADLFQEDRRAIQLYARRVLIMENCDKLLPQYLRFFRGVVDSEDLPLNVSREMLQEHKSLSAIRRALTRKALKLLAETADADNERYETLWGEFGAVIKEGLHLDSAHRDDLLGLCRYRSAATEGTWMSLAQYVENMAEGQEVIWFIAGNDECALRASPHLEAVRARGEDVLLMTDAVDEWVLQSVADFQGKQLRSVTQGRLEGDEDQDEEGDAGDLAPLVAQAREVLGDRVKTVRLSTRLKDSASCLVDAAGGLSSNMERILRMARQTGAGGAQKRILELNPEHAIVKATNELVKSSPEDARVGQWIELLHDLAALAEGSVPDPAATAKRVQAVLTEVATSKS